jgi:hypothetical protein
MDLREVGSVRGIWRELRIASSGGIEPPGSNNKNFFFFFLRNVLYPN